MNTRNTQRDGDAENRNNEPPALEEQLPAETQVVAHTETAANQTTAIAARVEVQ